MFPILGDRWHFCYRRSCRVEATTNGLAESFPSDLPDPSDRSWGTAVADLGNLTDSCGGALWPSPCALQFRIRSSLRPRNFPRDAALTLYWAFDHAIGSGLQHDGHVRVIVEPVTPDKMDAAVVAEDHAARELRGREAMNPRCFGKRFRSAPTRPAEPEASRATTRTRPPCGSPRCRVRRCVARCASPHPPGPRCGRSARCPRRSGPRR